MGTACIVIAVTTAADLEAAGRRAYLNNEPAAPALNAEVMAAVGDGPVGEPRTVAVMRAFTRGYEAERQAELDRLLAED